MEMGAGLLVESMAAIIPRSGTVSPHPLSVYPMRGEGISRSWQKVLGGAGTGRTGRVGRVGLGGLGGRREGSKKIFFNRWKTGE